MKASELYILNAGWNASTELDVYVEVEFKGRMDAHSMELCYGEFTVKYFNETYIVLEEEII